ncbi:MAG: RNA polymerase sigma-70 factor [Melioribacter sp.]|nr:RNA polymerase sigma-70 factor [Melioribacter sp.]
MGNPDKKIIELEWIEKIREGDKAAFKKLFEEYYPKLFWFVNRYLMSKEIADDVVKELFIELWQRKDRFVIQSSLNAYLYASARNRAFNYLRSKQSKEKYLTIRSMEDEELNIITSSTKTPSEVLEQKELSEAVQSAVELLPGRTKLVFTLHRDDGLTYAEIAQVLEISAKTVENQMARAFKILRSRLSYLLPVIYFYIKSINNVI